MFLLITLIWTNRNNRTHLNTSHVLINRVTAQAREHLQKNLNTSHVLINPISFLYVAKTSTDLNTSHVLINQTLILNQDSYYGDLNTSHVLINPTFLRIFLFISYLISLDFSTFLHFFTSRHPLSHISVIFLFFPRFYGMFPVFPIYAAW